MGCCYPVGASRGDSSPSRLMPSPQVGRERHVQAQQWEYEAGGTEATGCVIEPRKRLLLWSTGYPSEEIEGKADGVEKPEGSSPGHVMASGWERIGISNAIFAAPAAGGGPWGRLATRRLAALGMLQAPLVASCQYVAIRSRLRRPRETRM